MSPWTADTGATQAWAAQFGPGSGPGSGSAAGDDGGPRPTVDQPTAPHPMPDMSAPAAPPTPPPMASMPSAPGSEPKPPADSWYDPPPSISTPARPSVDLEATQAWSLEAEPEPEPKSKAATESKSVELAAIEPAAIVPPKAAARPGYQAEAEEPSAPESEATQVFGSPHQGTGPMQSWSGMGEQQTAPANSPGSIVPDSWFAGPRTPAAPSAPTEQWSAQPASPDLWAAQPPGDAAPGWGPKPHNEGWGPQPPHNEGWGPQPHNDHPPAATSHQPTAMLQTSDLPPPAGEGGGYPADGQRNNKASKPLIFGVVGLVVVALIAVTFVMWPDGDGGPVTQPTPAAVKSSTQQADPAAKTQAMAIESLLKASAASRGELGRALVAARKCAGLPTAIQGMQRVAQQRRRQLVRASALQVDALPNGSALRRHLSRSIQLSLQVDQAYLAWAQNARKGCKRTPKADANYRRGGVLSNQATLSKQAFAASWAPVAREQGLQPRTANQF